MLRSKDNRSWDWSGAKTSGGRCDDFNSRGGRSEEFTSGGSGRCEELTSGGWGRGEEFKSGGRGKGRQANWKASTTVGRSCGSYLQATNQC